MFISYSAIRPSSKEFGRKIQHWQLHLRQHTFSLKFWSAKYLVCKIHINKKVLNGKHHLFKISDIPRHAHIGLNLPPWSAWLTPSDSLTKQNIYWFWLRIVHVNDLNRLAEIIWHNRSWNTFKKDVLYRFFRTYTTMV